MHMAIFLNSWWGSVSFLVTGAHGYQKYIDQSDIASIVAELEMLWSKEFPFVKLWTF